MRTVSPKERRDSFGVISVHYLSVQFFSHFLDDMTCRVYNFFVVDTWCFLRRSGSCRSGMTAVRANPDVRVGINSSGTEWSVEKGATMGFERSPLYSTV